MEDSVKAGAACPISGRQVSSAASRLNAVMVTALLAAAVLVPNPLARWVMVFLFADYAIKVFLGFEYSPLCVAARALARALKLRTRMTDLAPKAFAALVGLFFAAAATAAWFGWRSLPAFDAFAGIWLVCAALDGFLGFCLGCWMYSVMPAGVRDRLVIGR